MWHCAGCTLYHTIPVLSLFAHKDDFTHILLTLLLQVPEQAEIFQVVLTGVTGAGRLDSQSIEATLTVTQNDDPINFNDSFIPATVTKSSPQKAQKSVPVPVDMLHRAQFLQPCWRSNYPH